MQRQLKKEVKIGSIKIGGTNPIAVQTMLNVPVKDIAGNVAQAERVAKAGCQIVRVTVPTPADAAVVAAIKEKVDIPIVADIHFDYRAALAALDAGADKIRINPGNIGMMTASRLWPTPATPEMCPSASASTAAASKSTSWPSTALPCRGHGGERHVPCAAAAKIRL